MTLPRYIQNVIDSFEMLPGIGPKTAQRLGFYLMRLPESEVSKFSQALKVLKESSNYCKRCFNISDDELCSVCQDLARDNTTVCVVESPLDLIALEKSNYKGIYHVLNGVINPIAGIGPDEIYIPQLFQRLVEEPHVSEIILATGTSLEGEASAMYIYKEIKKNFEHIKVSRIGKGLPIGADIEYADEGTLSDALAGRVLY